MSQQTMHMKPLTLGEAIWQLPRQYIKVLCKPSAQTFNEEMGKASWGITLIQFYLLIVIIVALSYLGHLIPSSALHTTSSINIGSVRLFAFLPSPYNGIVFILGSFLIGLCTAYLFSKLWRGKGTFLAHTYSLLLCTVPLVTISGALLLIPATGSLVFLLISIVLALFIYRMVLHALIIMAVHSLSGGRATLVVLIIPMLIVGIILLVGLFFLTEGGNLDGLGDTFGGIPGGSEKRKRLNHDEIT